MTVNETSRGYDWKALKRQAGSAPVRAGVLGWDQLPRLHEVFLTNAYDVRSAIVRWETSDVEGNDEAVAVALRYLFDIRRLGLVGRQSEFMRDMVERAESIGVLTPGQVRGVMNVLGGGLKWNRPRFKRSRGHRRDARHGDEECLVCGGPLTDDESVSRGVGLTCYRRIMGG